MASDTNFECFVTVGDTKFTICLDKDFNSVVFGDVYDHFRQLSDNSKFTFDDYIFEVFDFESSSYRRLTTLETPVAFLSRIRVVSKQDPAKTNNQPARAPIVNKRKNFESKFNSNVFNPDLIHSDRVNQNFFNVDLDNCSPMSGFIPKRRKTFLNDSFQQSLPNQRDWQMNDEFYNPDMSNRNQNYNFHRNYGYNDDNYNTNSVPMMSSQPYTRRPNLIQPPVRPIPSFGDPYHSPYPSVSTPYYRRRHEFMEPFNEGFSDYSYGQNNGQTFDRMRPQTSYQPNSNNNFGFWPSFAQTMNSNSNKGFTRANQNPRNGQRMQNTGPSFDKSLKESKTYLITNGFTIRSKGQTNEFFCEFCVITLTSIALAMNHIKTDVHSKNSTEKFLDPLDKLLMTKPNSKSLEVFRARRQQLRKISEPNKRKFVRHGIRLKQGTGLQAYVCIKCCSSMSSLIECHKHYEKFIELNKGLNYPKDYHTLDNGNNYPKISLRFKRILNALEVPVDDKRSAEVEKKLIELRNEATVQKEDTDKANTKYFSCLLCDKRMDSIDEAITHIKSAEHMKNRSTDRFKGLDRAYLMDTEKCGQIEVDLARKQESTALSHSPKEDYFDHGIRLKNGIEPEAYMCITCDKSFDSLPDVKIHYETLNRSEEAKRITETNDELLVDSAKKQLELLATNDKQDFTEDVDDSTLIDEFNEKVTKESIKEVTDNEKFKYHCCICDTYYLLKKQVIKHLSLTFHNRMKSGEFMKAVDKEFCCSSNRLNEEEVVSARLQILQRINDEAKAKFTEEGIRLRDGVGREAFWCMLCQEHILSPNVESSSLSFINHINYYPKHVELLINQQK